MSEPQKVTPTMEERATRLMEELDRRMGSRLSPLDGSGKEEREGGHRATVRALLAVQSETRAETVAELNAIGRAHPAFQALAIARQALGGEPATMTVNGEPAVGIIFPAYALEVVNRALAMFPDALPAKPEEER
jgi:hypothetical protein